MKILTVGQMTEVDRLSTSRYGIPSLLLMENAGLNLFHELSAFLGRRLARSRVLIVCGKGNNGGDGMVLARQLSQRHIASKVVLLGRPEEVSGDARVNLDILLQSGHPVVPVTEPDQWSQVEAELASYDCIVDALLGTGLSKPLQGLYRRAVQAINSSNAFVLAVDIPTGMVSDSLEAAPVHVRADLTVTFTAPKIAHIFTPDQASLGRLAVAPIGSPHQLLEQPEYYCNLMEPSHLAAAYPGRPLLAHKGSMGKVAVIGGSRGKSGAAALAGMAALRAGSGLITIMVPEDVQGPVASFVPDLMTEGLPQTSSGGLSLRALEPVLRLLESQDAAAVGPGLGTDPETWEFARQLVARSPVPLVIDADGLNALAAAPRAIPNSPEQPLVLTPHPGEFARLIHNQIPEVLKNRLELAREYAVHHNVWLVLKGFRTLVAEPTGQIQVCDRGNPGMATGGMGDALTGILLSHLGRLAAGGRSRQPTAVTDCVSLGVYLHSAAGDRAERDWGPDSLTASTLIDYLGEAIRELQSTLDEDSDA